MFMQAIARVVPFILLVGILSSAVVLFGKERQRRALQEDYVEISRIKYGLFNVDEWKTILADIITKKVREFDLDESNKEELERQVKELLYQIVDKLETSFFANQNVVERGVARTTGLFNRLREDIPDFAQDIVNFIDDPANREGLKQIILDQINELAENTFAEVDYSYFNAIVDKYDATSGEEARQIIGSTEGEITRSERPYFILIMILAICAGFWISMRKKMGRTDYLLFTILCFVLLITGLLLPMINIDARISNMSFSLIGEPVEFTDQVLFFQSKSIIQVATLLLTNGEFDLFLVGFLVFSFSVAFPMLKLLSGLLYAYYKKARDSRFVTFLLFKSGKWSMADVMVVAIFMAYIGFSGIVTEQMRQLERITENMEMLTTNESQLQVGFFIFTGFAILGLLMAQRMQSFKTEYGD